MLCQGVRPLMSLIVRRLLQACHRSPGSDHRWTEAPRPRFPVRKQRFVTPFHVLHGPQVADDELRSWRGA